MRVIEFKRKTAPFFSETIEVCNYFPARWGFGSLVIAHSLLHSKASSSKLRT
jgi:hypothetical protein